MNDSSPISINCSSSFSITSPRYFTYLSVIIAAALADSFFGEDDFFSYSASGSCVLIVRAGFLEASLDDLADDSSEALVSIILLSGRDNF